MMNKNTFLQVLLVGSCYISTGIQSTGEIDWNNLDTLQSLPVLSKMNEKVEEKSEPVKRRRYADETPSLTSKVWDFTKSAAQRPLSWLRQQIPSRDATWAMAKSTAYKPSTWIATGGTAYLGWKLGDALNNMNMFKLEGSLKDIGGHKIGLGIVGGAFLLSHIPFLIAWIKMRNEFLKLEQKQTGISDPSIRNVWDNPLSPDGDYFLDGLDMVKIFSEVDARRQELIRHSLMKQMGAQNDVEAMAKLDAAMAEVRERLGWYRNYTNIQYALSKSLSFTTPDELLTSDALIQNHLEDRTEQDVTTGDWHTVKAPLRTNFDHAIEYGIYYVLLDWNDKYDIPLPNVYSWTYRMASSCVWLSLRHYSFLKAIRKIMEHVVNDHTQGAQKHFVTINKEASDGIRGMLDTK